MCACLLLCNKIESTNTLVLLTKINIKVIQPCRKCKKYFSLDILKVWILAVFMSIKIVIFFFFVHIKHFDDILEIKYQF